MIVQLCHPNILIACFVLAGPPFVLNFFMSDAWFMTIIVYVFGVYCRLFIRVGPKWFYDKSCWTFLHLQIPFFCNVKLERLWIIEYDRNSLLCMIVSYSWCSEDGEFIEVVKFCCREHRSGWFLKDYTIQGKPWSSIWSGSLNGVENGFQEMSFTVEWNKWKPATLVYTPYTFKFHGQPCTSLFSMKLFKSSWISLSYNRIS